MKYKLAVIISILLITNYIFAIKNYSKIFPVIDNSGSLEIYVAYCEYENQIGNWEAKLDKLNISFDEELPYISEMINCYSIPGYYYNQYNFRSYGTRSFVKDQNDDLLLLIKRYYDEPISYYDFIYRATTNDINQFTEDYIFFPEQFVTSPRNYIHNIIKDCEEIIYISYEHEYGGPANDQFIYQTEDFGKTWGKILDSNHVALTNMLLKDVHPDDNNIMYFAKDDGYLYRSNDHGLTTTLVDSTNGMDWYEHIALNGNKDFIFPGNGLIYANCYSEINNCWKIMKSTDDGYNWTVLSGFSGYGLSCLNIDTLNPGVLYACDNYQIFKSVDYGASFTTSVYNNQSIAPIKGIYQIDGTDTIIFLKTNGLYVYSSSGQIYPLDGMVPNEDYEVEGFFPTIEANAFPNPFNPETTINYILPEDGITSVQVYNIKGQLVKTLISEFSNSGEHTIIWNGESNNERKCPSGLYLYQIKQNNNSITKKIILAK